ncbi:MAG: trigger factor [Anaerolineaceae bacterium]|nr:MAG: trigger factor [Anaerolineaceae bacterium]
MKIEAEELEDREVQLTVEVPSERLQSAMRTTARRLSHETKIPGFRPGKAPYNIVVQKFGEEVLFQETLDDLGQEIYRQALDQSELEPYGPGSLNEIVSRDPLVLRYTVPLLPEVDLGKYRELRLPYEEPEVSDETLEEAMERLRQSRALIEPVDRPVQLSDVVVIDIQGELREPPEGENAVILDNKGIEILVTEDTDWPVPGIVEHLLGLEIGSEHKFEYTFPEDYPSEDLRNLIADFHIKCLEVKSRFVPEWTDDLARNIGEYDDLLDLRLKLRENLQERTQQEAEAEYAQQVIEASVEGATIQFPPLMLQEETNELIAELEQSLQGQNLSLEDYLNIEKKSEEELRTELEPRARKRLSRALVLGKLVELEEIEVSEEEVTSEIDRIVAPFKEHSEELRKSFDNPLGRRRLTLDLLTNKTIKRMVAIARGEADKPPEPTETTEEEPTPEEDHLEKE